MPREFIPAAKPIIGALERSAVDAVIASGMVVQGPQVAAFEEEFAEQVVGGVYAVAVNSGTSAQHLATLASGLPEDAEVIVPSFTFAATANSVVLAGARPVFADIDLATFTLDPASVEAAITERTAAIEVVHLYGLPANMPAIMRIAEAHGLAVFEDCAQAHGAAIGSVPVGAFGAWGSFSFYPTKNMTSLEGGMVTTGDAALARRVRLLRNQGMERQYANELVGLNNRMTDVSAAVGRVQLGGLAGWTARRRANAAALNEGLAGSVGVITPTEPARPSFSAAALARRRAVHPASPPSCTRPTAADTSVMRLFSPTSSLAYCLSMPWLRSRRTRRASAASPVVTMPPSREVMFLVG